MASPHGIETKLALALLPEPVGEALRLALLETPVLGLEVILNDGELAPDELEVLRRDVGFASGRAPSETEDEVAFVGDVPRRNFVPLAGQELTDALGGRLEELGELDVILDHLLVLAFWIYLITLDWFCQPYPADRCFFRLLCCPLLPHYGPTVAVKPDCPSILSRWLCGAL